MGCEVSSFTVLGKGGGDTCLLPFPQDLIEEFRPLYIWRRLNLESGYKIEVYHMTTFIITCTKRDSIEPLNYLAPA